MAKNKFYAIKKGNGVKNKIVSSWDECKKLVDGYQSEFKSFKNKEDALKYLGIKEPKEKSKNNDIVNLKVNNKSNKNKSFTVQISDELYNDFIKKCNKKHISKDFALAFLMNQWTYEEDKN